MTDHRVALLSILGVLAGCHASAAPVTPATRASSAAGAAPWLVTIVVDQLAAWMADERWPLLPDDGGFARLRREGLTVRQLRFTHAITDTAPGHSALFTGVVPHTSGIVANDVISSAGKKISILADAKTRLVPVGGAGPVDRPGSSLAALQSDTIADALLAARPDARIFSFSLKDRGALFVAVVIPSWSCGSTPKEAPSSRRRRSRLRFQPGWSHSETRPRWRGPAQGPGNPWLHRGLPLTPKPRTIKRAKATTSALAPSSRTTLPR